MAKLYVSNKRETVRMFESNFMEFFSHVHPATPIVLYVPVIGFLLYDAVAHKHLPVTSIASLFLAGILIWTLLEYVIHRYIFHYEPKTRWGKVAAFCGPWRAPRLPERSDPAGYAPGNQYSSGRRFLFAVYGKLRPVGSAPRCRFWLRLCLLRHDSLRDPPFLNEGPDRAMAEAISSSPSLQRRPVLATASVRPCGITFSEPAARNRKRQARGWGKEATLIADGPENGSIRRPASLINL